ncbi:MAG: hypothetical protein PWR10_1536 [Halanaerobiales bacterium]|nr:hypothetical protein [Halanaerobiales bacterium]
MFLGTFFFFFGIGVFIALVWAFFKYTPAIIYMIFDLIRTAWQEIKKGWEAGAPENAKKNKSN